MKKKSTAPNTINCIYLFCIVISGLLTIIGTSGDEIEEEPQGLNTNPVAAITSPDPNTAASFVEGDRVTFSGTATDAEDGTLSGGALVWTSSKNGWLGTGTSIHDITLATGGHEITLSAADSRGGSGSTSMVVNVLQRGNTVPVATIVEPIPGEAHSFSLGDYVKLSGTGVDTEDGVLSGTSLVWTSNRDGQLGMGGTLDNVNFLSTGIHTILLMATDSDGTTGTASVALTIGNLPPTATINTPSDGAEFNMGEFVFFSGTVTDPEDGELHGSALEWRSSKNGKLGNGSTLAVSNLSVGSHSISLVATDSGGTEGFAEPVTISVINTPPEAVINLPTSGSTYFSGDLIIFTGTGTDDEDGSLSGTALVWTSNIDGHIGTGNSFSTSSLSVNDHIIRLTVTDSGGAINIENTDNIKTITIQ